jgi:hypothetical protein
MTGLRVATFPFGCGLVRGSGGTIPELAVAKPTTIIKKATSRKKRALAVMVVHSSGLELGTKRVIQSGRNIYNKSNHLGIFY